MLRSIGLALALAFLGTPAAWAEKPDHAGKGNPHAQGAPGKGQGKDKGKDDVDIGVHVHFTSPQREQVRVWFGGQYGRGNCPPGLAKKHNGCLPPGIAKKRYQLGYPLPPGLVLGPVPPGLVAVIGPPPHGHYYGVVDGDLLKLAVGTALVVDAIDGLVE